MKIPVLWSGMTHFVLGASVNSTSYIKKIVNCAIKLRLAKSPIKCCKTHLNISLKKIRDINAIPLTALNGKHSEIKTESVPMEFLTDSQVSYHHRSYERNLINCIQKPEKVRTSIYFIYHFTLTDSLSLIHVWKLMCGNSLPFDVFFSTMTGVELFPGRDLFTVLTHRTSFHSPTLKYSLTSAL